ncbi:hypothetical protein [Cytobacillus praedii]|nr:hypothetical protein [Cytobacillus praedii]
MFNEKSGLVQLWVKNVMDPNSGYTKEMVPNLSNLQTIVYSILDSE